MKWYEYPDVRVKVTFRFKAMSAEDYALWQVEEANLLRLSEVGELWDGLAKYGYDLFDVAWLNLVKVRGSNAALVYTRGSLVRTGERSMAVRMRPKKTTVRQMTGEDRERLAAAVARRGSSPPLEPWELVARDRMGIEWLKCHAADEAYEVDYAEKEELDAWRAHAFMQDDSSQSPH
jgi:hypothetical protein